MCWVCESEKFPIVPWNGALIQWCHDLTPTFTNVLESIRRCVQDNLFPENATSESSNEHGCRRQDEDVELSDNRSFLFTHSPFCIFTQRHRGGCRGTRARGLENNRGQREYYEGNLYLLEYSWTLALATLAELAVSCECGDSRAATSLPTGTLTESTYWYRWLQTCAKPTAKYRGITLARRSITFF